MRMGRLTVITFALGLLAVSAPVAASAQLTLAQANTALDAAQAEAERNGWNLTFVVASADGVPIAVRRMDGASTRSFEIAMRKVATVIGSGMSSEEYGQALQAGRISEVENAVTFAGGLPVRVGSELVGAMSASGARANEDAQSVVAGLTAIGMAP